MLKGRVVAGGRLTDSCERRNDGQGETDRHAHWDARFQRRAGRGREPSWGAGGEPSSEISAKRRRKAIEWERLEIASRKSEIPVKHFMQRWAQ